MPLIKRKAVLYHPLPSLAAVLQPYAPPPNAPTASGAAGPSSSPAPAPSSIKGNKKQPNIVGWQPPAPPGSEIATPIPTGPVTLPEIPPDATDEDVQLDRLLAVFREDLGMKRKDRQGRVKEHVRVANGREIKDALAAVGEGAAAEKKKTKGANGTGGEMPPPEIEGAEEEWRIWDRECFYVHETGEIFTDYE